MAQLCVRLTDVHSALSLTHLLAELGGHCRFLGAGRLLPLLLLPRSSPLFIDAAASADRRRPGIQGCRPHGRIRSTDSPETD